MRPDIVAGASRRCHRPDGQRWSVRVSSAARKTALILSAMFMAHGQRGKAKRYRSSRTTRFSTTAGK